jgi:hypothetical protein
LDFGLAAEQMTNLGPTLEKSGKKGRRTDRSRAPARLFSRNSFSELFQAETFGAKVSYQRPTNLLSSVQQEPPPYYYMQPFKVAVHMKNTFSISEDFILERLATGYCECDENMSKW